MLAETTHRYDRMLTKHETLRDNKSSSPRGSGTVDWGFVQCRWNHQTDHKQSGKVVQFTFWSNAIFASLESSCCKVKGIDDADMEGESGSGARTSSPTELPTHQAGKSCVITPCGCVASRASRGRHDRAHACSKPEQPAGSAIMGLVGHTAIRGW